MKYGKECVGSMSVYRCRGEREREMSGTGRREVDLEVERAVVMTRMFTEILTEAISVVWGLAM